jgi:hypothetical protein
LPIETWRMSSKRYLVLQGRITRSSHYDDISMKSLTKRQFRDAFSNESGDVAIQFDGITTWLTVPWRDFVNVSRCIMLFDFPFEQGLSFAKLFQKMKAQHAHHIFCQFALEYFGDSRASSMLFIKYQQARLNAVAEMFMSSQGNTSSVSNLFHDSSFKTERFQYWFDRYCEHAFLNCMNSYNNYSQPLLAPDDFMKRTLDGMMRQGQFIGLTQKAKQVIETIYSPGAISDRIVHRSETGSKGDCPQRRN